MNRGVRRVPVTRRICIHVVALLQAEWCTRAWPVHPPTACSSSAWPRLAPHIHVCVQGLACGRACCVALMLVFWIWSWVVGHVGVCHSASVHEFLENDWTPLSLAVVANGSSESAKSGVFGEARDKVIFGDMYSTYGLNSEYYTSV